MACAWLAPITLPYPEVLMNTSLFDIIPPTVAAPVTDTLVAVSVAAVVVPVNVGEALGAKMVVMSLLPILSEGAVT